MISLDELKLSLIEEVKLRKLHNSDLLVKLIIKADSEDEVLSIAKLGHIYKKLDNLSIKSFVKNEYLSFMTDENSLTHQLIIGDNYDALSYLTKDYKDRIDVIYIDPPYGRNGVGDYAHTNYSNSLSRDNLLSMLSERLILARYLLSENGIIFCSIDDKNQAYVKCLFDSIFGENNFVGSFIWVNSSSSNSKFINIQHEYILTYCKDVKYQDKWFIPRDREFIKEVYSKINNYSSIEDKEKCLKEIIKNKIKNKDYTWFKNYSNISDDGRIYYAQDLSLPTKPNRVELSNGLILEPLPNRGWSSKEILEELLRENRLVWKGDRPYKMKYLEESVDNIQSLICDIYTRNGKEDLKEIFESNGTVFQYPKPVQLIKRLLSIFHKDVVVLDFFAGSGTTGQAVLELNQEDEGNRKFILCTNNEKTDINPNGIAYDVTSKRLKRVMTGSCYDGTIDFKYDKILGDNLDVYDLV